jgi:hypothetical protein
MAIIGKREELGDDRISSIARADEVRWWKKPNLRFLYLILVPCGLGVEWTSGFDSSMMNSCACLCWSWLRALLTRFDSTSC